MDFSNHDMTVLSSEDSEVVQEIFTKPPHIGATKWGRASLRMYRPKETGQSSAPLVKVGLYLTYYPSNIRLSILPDHLGRLITKALK